MAIRGTTSVFIPWIIDSMTNINGRGDTNVQNVPAARRVSAYLTVFGLNDINVMFNFLTYLLNHLTCH